MSDPLSAAPTNDRGWLSFQHNWLDARLGAMVMNMWAAWPVAREEIATYRREHEDHTRAVRERVCTLPSVDSYVVERWSDAASDVREAARTVELWLQCPDSGSFAAFDALRHTVQRQWMAERRLFDVAEPRGRAPRHRAGPGDAAGLTAGGSADQRRRGGFGFLRVGAPIKRMTWSSRSPISKGF
jgi:hypothetical protein